MEIKQFYDVNLSHASYAVLSENEIALIDPSRDPGQYYKFAEEHNAKIIAVIETHPHADFVSSHLEISKTTGAKIYVSNLVNPLYSFTPFDEGNELFIGKIKLIPINTPGHSPDSICILIKDEEGNDYAIATGDTLFVGDVGRPDLRESAGSINKSREELAKMMYDSLRNKLFPISDSVIVYPAHGAGSLCGKSKSTETFSTIGKEKKDNYALQPMSEEDFITELLKDQSYIPKYFGYNVELNRKGAPDFIESISNVKRINSYSEIQTGILIIDTRDNNDFINGHYKNSINIPEDKRFETWLGTIVSPEEKYYLVSDNSENLERIISRTSKIGYEQNIAGALIHKNESGLIKSIPFDLENFKLNPQGSTIVDIRNKTEVRDNKIFTDSISIPLNELRERYREIPAGKPVVVHCAAGARSAIGSSILQNLLDEKVFDLSHNIKLFSEK